MGASIKFNGGQPVAGSLGSVFPLIIEVTGPDSYAADGFAVSATTLGLSAVAQVGVLSCSGGVLAEYVKSTGKIKLLFPTGGDDDSPTDPTDDPVVTLSGTEGAADTAVLTPGVAKEIADTADCSALIVTLLVIGRV